jgi:hypothetical protein
MKIRLVGAELQVQVSCTKYSSILARALTPYPGDLNHCRSCMPASEDELKSETCKAEVNRQIKLI